MTPSKNSLEMSEYEHLIAIQSESILYLCSSDVHRPLVSSWSLRRLLRVIPKENDLRSRSKYFQTYLLSKRRAETAMHLHQKAPQKKVGEDPHRTLPFTILYYT